MSSILEAEMKWKQSTYNKALKINVFRSFNHPFAGE